MMRLMASILSVTAARRRTMRESLLAAAFFALELAAVATVISVAYHYFGQPGATWAIISSVLVLYPGITQSFSAAFLRIFANLLGSLVGLAIGAWLGTDMPQVILALVIVIFIGELLQMDLALRTACVAAIIVMSANDHNVRLSAIERISAVIAGCAAALAVQIAVKPIARRLPFIARTENAPQMSTNAAMESSAG